jgi:hypothetical protein
VIVIIRNQEVKRKHLKRKEQQKVLIAYKKFNQVSH